MGGTILCYCPFTTVCRSVPWPIFELYRSSHFLVWLELILQEAGDYANIAKLCSEDRLWSSLRSPRKLQASWWWATVRATAVLLRRKLQLILRGFQVTKWTHHHCQQQLLQGECFIGTSGCIFHWTLVTPILWLITILLTHQISECMCIYIAPFAKVCQACNLATCIQLIHEKKRTTAVWIIFYTPVCKNEHQDGIL